MPERDDDLLTIEDAATKYGLSRATLYRAVRAGELTLVRKARGRPRVFVERRDVRRLVEPRRERKRRGAK